MAGYLIYHPKRKVRQFENLIVYHDSTTGNQDPYIWNRSFLHTYCHITQMSPEKGHINFWLGGDTLPEFTRLDCDLVFVVDEKVNWRLSNHIDRNDPIVESDEAYNDHYQWAMYQHDLQRRRRSTLKANPLRSFQPQNKKKELINVLPLLVDMGMSLKSLCRDLEAAIGSRPRPLDDVTTKRLYSWVQGAASIRLRGDVLAEIRKQHTDLASPNPSP